VVALHISIETLSWDKLLSVSTRRRALCRLSPLVYQGLGLMLLFRLSFSPHQWTMYECMIIRRWVNYDISMVCMHLFLNL
jgi:hypothetical protein